MKITLEISTLELNAGASYINAIQQILTALGSKPSGLSAIDKLALFLGKEIQVQKQMISYTISKKNGVHVSIDAPAELVVDILELYADTVNALQPVMVGLVSTLKAVSSTFEARVNELVIKHKL